MRFQYISCWQYLRGLPTYTTFSSSVEDLVQKCLKIWLQYRAYSSRDGPRWCIISFSSGRKTVPFSFLICSMPCYVGPFPILSYYVSVYFTSHLLVSHRCESSGMVKREWNKTIGRQNLNNYRQFWWKKRPSGVCITSIEERPFVACQLLFSGSHEICMFS